MSPDSVAAHNVDLTNCDREQVQFSGAVQPHGCMLVLDDGLLRVTQMSANAPEMLGLAAADLLGGTLESVLGKQAAAVTARLRQEALDNGPLLMANLEADGARWRCDLNLFAHRCGGLVIFEFEIVPAGERPTLDLYSELRAITARLQTTTTLRSFLELAVAKIRGFTGFDRVMAYKFLEDGSGHVVAEAKRDGVPSYLDLHYPASDIPAPARRLFALAWLRHLPDVDYQPIPLVGEPGRGEAAPVDLSYAMLRSVSVMYTGYLKNMGVRASMVMPLMKDGALWGLLACNHEAGPRHVPYETRMAAEFLANLISLMMAAKEESESLAYRMRMKTVLDGMMRSLNEHADLHTGLGGNGPTTIGTYIEAGGAALVTEGQISRFGVTPDDDALRELGHWFAGSDELILATDRLPEHYSNGGRYGETAAGVLAVRLSKRRPEYVAWFRPAQSQTVLWAGDPSKPVSVDESDGVARLSPRGSFDLWKQSVEGRATPWADHEIRAAAGLRWAIVEVILARAEETELVNRELRDANSELDSFAYVASHDLKEPLRGINHLATFLRRGIGDHTQQVETILKLTRRMDDLIESLLQFSRVGRVELAIGPCDLDRVLDEALLVLASRIEETGTQIRRAGKLPVVQADRARLREVLVNLIGNAIKYNDKNHKWVEIGARPGPPLVITVSDNGLGIEERHHERIFEIFRRLHGRDDFGGGSGAGLTIVKKTIERHGGRIWLTSEPGEGSVFQFTLDADAQAAR